jgi:hypothetical protein
MSHYHLISLLELKVFFETHVDAWHHQIKICQTSPEDLVEIIKILSNGQKKKFGLNQSMIVNLLELC